MGCTVSCVTFAARLEPTTLEEVARAFDWTSRGEVFLLVATTSSLAPGATLTGVSLWTDLDGAPWDDFARRLVDALDRPALALTVSDHGQVACWQALRPGQAGAPHEFADDAYLDAAPEGLRAVFGLEVADARRLTCAEALTTDASEGLCLRSTSRRVSPGWLTAAQVKAVVEDDLERVELECCLLAHGG